jgi:beta-lactamase superfamily II metal-dependent hydrolase
VYGSPPARDEFEVTLLGPGYGEAVIIHLGENRWILVDSCLDPENGEPASSRYLRGIGVDLGNVCAIVASHWHDDHVAGLSNLVQNCPKATFYLSGVFSDKEAKAFLAAYSGTIAIGQTAGTKELFKVVSSHGNPVFAYQRTILHEENIRGRIARVLAFSPTQTAQVQTLARWASYIPATNIPVNHAPSLSPNLEAVVMHVDFGNDAVLLGSDLENHGTFGWAEIIADAICSRQRKASIYKVAHHGSATAELPKIWTQLLLATPIAAITPFNNGVVHLPNPSDKKRIRGTTPNAYLSSDATKRPKIPSALMKRMTDISKNLSPRNAGFGAIRVRKRDTAAHWNVSLFGAAVAL